MRPYMLERGANSSATGSGCFVLTLPSWGSSLQKGLGMTHLSSVLSPRLLLLLLAVFFMLLLMAILLLGHVHLAGIPTFAQSTMAVID